MIVWNILGWMLVIILGLFLLPILLPIFLGLIIVLGYIIFWTVMGTAAIISLLFDKIKSIFIKDKNKDNNNKKTNNVYKTIELSGEEFEINDEHTFINAKLDSNKWKINFVDILTEGTTIIFKQFPEYNYNCLLTYINYEDDYIEVYFTITHKYIK